MLTRFALAYWLPSSIPPLSTAGLIDKLIDWDTSFCSCDRTRLGDGSASCFSPDADRFGRSFLKEAPTDTLPKFPTLTFPDGAVVALFNPTLKQFVRMPVSGSGMLDRSPAWYSSNPLGPWILPTSFSVCADAVTYLYRTALCRDPETAALAGDVAQCQAKTGGTSEWLKDAGAKIRASAEYTAKPSGYAECAAGTMATEQFKVVDIGGGEIALLNPATNQYVRVPTSGTSLDRSATRSGETRLKPVDVGNGEIALLNSALGQFVRMAGSRTDIEKSAVRGDGILPASWVAERFKVVCVSGCTPVDGAYLYPAGWKPIKAVKNNGNITAFYKISNLRRYDYGGDDNALDSEATARPCVAGLGDKIATTDVPANGMHAFTLDPDTDANGVKDGKLRLKSLTDYEDCKAWEFDVVGGPSAARFFRVRPLKWTTGFISMRLSAILSDGSTLNGDKYTASSVKNGDKFGSGNFRPNIDSAQAWTAATEDLNQWIQLEVPEGKHVDRLVTQGRADETQFVREFNIDVSNDGTTFERLAGGISQCQDSTIDSNGIEPVKYSLPSSADVVVENAPGVGSWGGYCTCPSGVRYSVGDENNGCGSLACTGGTASACSSGTPSSMRRRVTCGDPTVVPVTGCPWVGIHMSDKCNKFAAVRQNCRRSCGLCTADDDQGGSFLGNSDRNTKSIVEISSYSVTCGVRWMVTDQNDKPFWKEGVAGGDRYGTQDTVLSRGICQAKIKSACMEAPTQATCAVMAKTQFKLDTMPRLDLSIKEAPVGCSYHVANNAACWNAVSQGVFAGSMRYLPVTSVDATIAVGAWVDVENPGSFGTAATIEQCRALNWDARCGLTGTEYQLKAATPTLETRRTVVERASVNMVVGDKLAATDLDLGQGLVFTIVSGNDDGMFRIDQCSGQLYVAKAGLDFTKKNQYVLTVGVTDDEAYFGKGSSKATSDTTVYIDLLDVNDDPIICVANSGTTLCTDTLAVLEMYADGTTTDPVFGAKYVKDPDGDALRYSFKAEYDSGTFYIDDSTGNISPKRGVVLDYNRKRYYQLTVIVEDVDSTGTLRGGKDQHTFALNVLQSNNAPVVPADVVLFIPENSVKGESTTNGFAATDSDGGGAVLKYNLVAQKDASGGTVALFRLGTVDSRTKAVSVVLVKNAAGLDYEDVLNTCARPCRYTLDVTVTDSGVTGLAACGAACGPKTTSASIVVEVSDVNEPPSLTTTSVTVKENVAVGSPIQMLGAQDVDDTVIKWTQALAKVAGTSTTDVGQAKFNALFAASPHRILRRECSGCANTHKDIYLRRFSSASWNAYDNMKVTWSSYNNNMAGGDFQLYSTYQDARDDKNAWQYCNYDDVGVAFPRECGPTLEAAKAAATQDFCAGYTSTEGVDKWDATQCNQKLDGEWVAHNGLQPAMGKCIDAPAKDWCKATCRKRCADAASGPPQWNSDSRAAGQMAYAFSIPQPAEVIQFAVVATRKIGADGSCSPAGVPTTQLLSATSGGALTAFRPIDFEEMSTASGNPFCIEIKVNDGNGASNVLPGATTSYPSVKVTVLDVNEPPIISGGQMFSVFENTLAGDGSFGTVVATDVDNGDAVALSLVDAGTVKTCKPPPFLAANCLEITVSGGGHSDTNGVYHRSTAGLPNGGDSSTPYFCKSTGCADGVFSQWGTTAYGWGTQVRTGGSGGPHHTYMNKVVSPTVTAFDQIRAGYGVAPIPSFCCSRMVGEAPPLVPFAMNAAGALTVKSGGIVDYEAQASYILSVKAMDSTKTAENTVTVLIIVGVVDVNEAPVVAKGLSFSISEHNAGQADCTVKTYCKAGSEVGYVTAIDADRVGGKPEGFLFVFETGSNTDGTFAIDAGTGLITVAVVSDNLAKEGHTFTPKVVATDSRGKTSAAVVVTVTVVKVNFSPEFTPAGATSIKSLPENVATARDLATITVVDPDNNYPLQVKIKAVDPPNLFGSFALAKISGSPTQGEKWSLRALKPVDFETTRDSDGKRQVCFTLDAVDSGGAGSSASGYCVTIDDVNEPPQLISTAFAVDEGFLATRQYIGTLDAKDEDAADAAGVDYGIKQSESDYGTKGCPFELVRSDCTTRGASLDGTCRDLYLKPDGLDYENLELYGSSFDSNGLKLVIQIVDSDPARKASPLEVPIYVTVNDLNEAPVIEATKVVSILETAKIGDVLGVPLVVSDPDDVQRNLMITVLDPSPDENTTIYPTTGRLDSSTIGVTMMSRSAELKLLGGDFDFEDEENYYIVVRADDGGNADRAQFPKSSTAVVKIAVQNKNDVTVDRVLFLPRETVESPADAEGVRTAHAAAIGASSADPCSVAELCLNEGACVKGTAKRLDGTSSTYACKCQDGSRGDNCENTVSYQTPTSMSTAGGDAVEVTGSNFGPTANKMSKHGATVPLFEVTYGAGRSVGGAMVYNAFVANNCKRGVTGGGDPESIKTAHAVANDASAADPCSTVGLCLNEATCVKGAVTRLDGTTSTYSCKCASDAFSGENCENAVSNTVLRCVTVGLSKQVAAYKLHFSVKAGADLSASPSSESVSFSKPVLTAVVADATMLSTVGGDKVTLKGSNFGTASPFLVTALGKVEYSSGLGDAGLPSFQAATCVSVSDGELDCTSSPGTGTNLEWRVMTGGQVSNVLKSSISFKPPTVTKVVGTSTAVSSGLTATTAASTNKLLTVGGEEVFIQGKEFGPMGTPVAAEYVQPGGVAYAAQSCRVTVANTEIGCQTVPGVGSEHIWRVAVITGGVKQWSSTPSGDLAPLKTSYHPPELVAINDGATELATDGGQEITLQGKNFGPSTDATLGCGDQSRPTLIFGGKAGGTGVVKMGTATQLVAKCCSVLSPTAVRCLSPVGVGRDFDWQISVGAQKSNILSSANTGYGPPILIRYRGVGSKDALTEGGQDVLLEGKNFGPAKLANGLDASVAPLVLASISTVTYGKTGTEYTVDVSTCKITTDHFMVTCATVPGGGKGLKWFIDIDGQRSIAASTYYGLPDVASITGPAAAILSTLGGEKIVIAGSNFGPDVATVTGSPSTGRPFLEKVTYGPNGIEYTARDCSVTKNSKEITCTTVPGVGAALQWRITVEGQQSTSFAWSTYIPPEVLSMAPAEGPTEGGVQVKIVGKGFGVLDRSSQVYIQFGTQTLSEESGAVEVGVGAVAGTETATFSLPELYGSVDVHVGIKMASGITKTSEPKIFTYMPPKIDTLVSEWADIKTGLLRVTARGSNFCVNKACGSVYVNGGLQVASSVDAWSHTHVSFVTSLDKGNVAIAVGGLRSNTWGYSHLSPMIHPDTVKELAGRKFSTPGRETVVIKGYSFGKDASMLHVTTGPVRADGTRAEAVIQPSSFLELTDPDGVAKLYSIVAELPAGQGSNQDIIVWRGKQPSRAAKISYHKPSVDAVVVSGSASTSSGSSTGVLPLAPTTGGVTITITGSNFGISGYVLIGTIKVRTETQSHVQATFKVPPGQGTDLPIVLWAGDQNSIESGVASKTISYQRPTLSGFIQMGRRRRMSTAAARRHLLANSSGTPADKASAEIIPEVATCSMSPPTSGVGQTLTLPPGRTEGQECIVIKGTNFGSIPARVFFGPFEGTVAARDTVKHEWLIVASPAGEGAGLQLTVMVGTGDTSQNVTLPYAYAAPLVTSVSPRAGSTSGRDEKGLPVVMTIEGRNFGRPTGSAQEIRITPVCEKCKKSGSAPFVIRVAASTFISRSHTKITFFVPEGYGTGSVVTVQVANQESVDAITFDYSVPTITKLSPYCGDRYKCRAPVDKFDTDGCSNVLLWEDYTDWRARRVGTKITSSSDLDRRCGVDNDRWEMVIIEGTSLGSTALSASGAPLRVALNKAGQAEDFVLGVGTNANCPECSHNHTHIIARSAQGYGRGLKLSVALGESVSNTLSWNFKPPEVRAIDSDGGSIISANTGGSVILRGRNFGHTGNPAQMPVRVFFGYDYNLQGEPTGYMLSGSGDAGANGGVYDLAAKWPDKVTSDDLKFLVGKGMKECKTTAIDDISGETKSMPARWQPSYNYTVRGARNVDGHPYVVCSPKKDVSGPKNVTFIFGDEMDSCATNYRLCADPISFSDRRMKKPADICEQENLAAASLDAEIPLTAASDNASTAIAITGNNECRDDSFCTWDCFSASLFVSQCPSDKNGQTSYAKAGQLCSTVENSKAVCQGDDCMTLDATAGFYMLTVDINCSKTSPYDACEVTDGVVQWRRPKEARRAMGADTELKKPRCPVERWEPLVPATRRVSDPPVDYDQYEGIIQPTECFDIVSCHPTTACNGSNVCNSNGYEYTKNTCQYFMDKIPNASLTCSSNDQCRTMDQKGVFGGLPFSEGQAIYSEPQSQSRCIKREDPVTGRVVGRCECFTSPRCSLCTVGSNWLGLKEDSPYYTEGYFRLNGECEKCPDNPGLLVGCFLLGMVGLCMGCWFLQKKDFNVAFISIGWDYFQVLALFARADIEWPPLMQAMFTFFSAFNFNIDITAPECLVPNLDYRLKWWFIMLLPLAAIAFLFAAFFIGVCVERMRGVKKNISKQFSKIVAIYLLIMYYVYLAVTRRALDVFNCNPSVPSDGYLYTEFTSIDCEGGLCKCGIPGSVQAGLFPWALGFLALYSIGFPGFVAYAILSNKEIVKEDQVLRAHNLASSKKINARAHDIRKRYHKMYYHFKPGKIYWILVIIFRKFAIAFIGLMFRKNPGFQLALCLLTLFACYIMQAKHRPYMSNSEREHVKSEHREKVALFRRLEAAGATDMPSQARSHYRIHKHMEMAHNAAAEKNKPGRKRSNSHAVVHAGPPGDKKTRNKPKKKAEDDKVYFFDYNTVEQTLLGCAVLVCLSGVMFENERFLTRTDVNFEKELITWCVFGVIFGSLIYYMLVFVAEVMGYVPTCLLKRCGSRKSREELATSAIKKQYDLQRKLTGGVEMVAPGSSQNVKKDPHHRKSIMLTANPMGSFKGGKGPSKGPSMFDFMADAKEDKEEVPVTRKGSKSTQRAASFSSDLGYALGTESKSNCLPGCRGHDGTLHKNGHHIRCPNYTAAKEEEVKAKVETEVMEKSESKRDSQRTKSLESYKSSGSNSLLRNKKPGLRKVGRQFQAGRRVRKSFDQSQHQVVDHEVQADGGVEVRDTCGE